MDREAFKQRMQSLKSYREQNPGKGYLDWKASLPDNLQDDSSYNLKRAYELGYEPEYIEEDRSYHLPTRDSETGEILKKPWHPTFLIGLQEDAKLGYYPQTIDGTTYTTTWEGNENPIYKYADGGEVSEEVKNKTEFHRNWYAPRVDLLGKNKKQLGTSLINQLSSDNYLGKKEYNRIINNISKIPEVDRVTANDEQIDRIVKSINQSVDSDNTINKEDALKYHRLLNKATTYFGDPSFIYYNKQSPEIKVHERTHASDAYVQEQLIRQRNIEGKKSNSYYDNPSEIYSRLMEVRYMNHLNPLEIITDDKIEELRENGKDSNLLNNYNNEDLKFLFNDIALNQNNKSDNILHAKNGGEIPPEPIPYKGKLYTDRYGKKYTEQQVAEYYQDGTDEIDRFTGGPLVRGLKPLLDLEDAANFTPVGDAVAAYDVYDAVSNRDWSGAGLAALGLVPFMPMTVKQFRSKYKGITPKTKSKGGYGHNFNTSVNKNITNNQLDNIINTSAEDLAKRTKAVNQSYNAAERLMDDPEYITRANQVKRQFGDDYTTAYADIINAYNDDPTKLPKLAEINDKLSSATGTMYKDMDNNGEFYYGINPKRTKLGNYLTEHEWSHYIDMLKAGDLPSADAGNNMFYQMSKDIINGIDNRDWYFTQPTEQKAHMNQLREYMFNNGHISRRGQAVSPKMMKKVIEEVSNIDSMREVARASRQFNNINKYTRWFNAIPLLGLGAAAVYRGKEE